MMERRAEQQVSGLIAVVLIMLLAAGGAWYWQARQQAARFAVTTIRVITVQEPHTQYQAAVINETDTIMIVNLTDTRIIAQVCAEIMNDPDCDSRVIRMCDGATVSMGHAGPPHEVRVVTGQGSGLDAHGKIYYFVRRNGAWIRPEETGGWMS